MDLSPLNNPVWHALNSHHRHLAIQGDPARRRSGWTRARDGRAGGIHCAPYECWTGIQHKADADLEGL
jgi:hypothetical protein